MKSRSLKLRDAHQSTSGAPALCSVIWDADGARVITASAADPTVLVHNASRLSDTPSPLLCHHREGVTVLAFSPASNSLASGSLDHSVKLYKFPEGRFQTNITRFTLPIRSLAFNKSGSLLAAAGDDEGIKLVATIDCSISRLLKGHSNPVTSLAFDPLNEYLASSDSHGTVIFWELSSGKQVHTLKAVAPNFGSDTTLINVVSWSPDGDRLAVAGLRNDVVMYDRDTAEKLFTIKGDHEKSICFLSWSPNGKYIATSGLDNQVLIWDIDLRQDIERHKFDDRISCLAWKPNGNALAVIDIMGKYGVWETVIPSSMKSPVDGVSTLRTNHSNGLLLFDDEDEKPKSSESLDEVSEGSHGELASMPRKRRKKAVLEDCFDEDSDEEELLHHKIEPRQGSSSKSEKGVPSKEQSATSGKCSRPKMQEAFQPGSTPAQVGKRWFLSYNMLGSITTIGHDGYHHIEVDFHDTGRGPRVPSMTDYFGFTMASLNENGSIFASPCKDEKNTSTLMYRPFSSWANNSEWSMRFEAEEVKAVAIGIGWVAAVTSLNFLRIFTEGGLQKHILCLNGAVVAAAGYGGQLAIVTHSSDCLPSGDPILDVMVLNISDGTQPIGCRLPLTPSSSLSWFGFSEEGQLSAYDSKGTLRVFSTQFGGTWLPLFSANKARNSDEKIFWVVGLNSSKLFCVECKTPDDYPSVIPKPVLTLLDLSFPLARSDLGATDLENEFIMCNLHLSKIHKKIEDCAAAGFDTTALDDEAFDVEATLDRCILRLIANCCNGDKLVRATELARLLSLDKSLKGAIKLVHALKLPNLAERFNCILEERLSGERKQTVTLPSVTSCVSTSNALTSKPPSISTSNALTSKAPSIHKTAEPICIIPEQKLAHSLSSNEERVEEKTDHERDLPNAKVSILKENRKDNNKLKETEISASAAKHNSKDLEKNKSNVNACQGGSSEATGHRPSNPFAKASNNQNKSSLLDSIKKMKADSEIKVGRTSKKLKP